MPFLSLDIIVIGICVTWLASTYIVRRNSTRQSSLPPGPPSNAIIGNLLHIPRKSAAWVTFTEWKESYGDIVHLHGLGNSIIILNSMKAVNDLMDKRGNIYSHRPTFTMVGELMGLDRGMPLLACDSEWRMQRKLTHIALSPEAVKKYYSVQEDLAALLNQALLETPEDFFAHVRLVAGRIIMAITYGLPVKTADSEYITHAEATMEMIGRTMTPGAYLVDLMPPLKHIPRWMPFASFHKEGQDGRAMIEKLVTDPFLHVKQEMKSGTAWPSLTHDLLNSEEGQSGEDQGSFEERVKWTGGALYGAAGESTYVTILTLILALALYPDKQRTAQAEIDRMLGPDTLPEIKDRPRLPYINAVVKETMRWHPALPLGIARRTGQEDVYEGYTIPVGSTVLPNVWAIAYDTPQPEDFMPERFLDGRPITDPHSYAFGFGRRICPGKALAENSLFILTATIIANFTISLPLNEKGREIPLEPKFANGLVSYPERYRCRIIPRSTDRIRLVEARAAACRV